MTRTYLFVAGIIILGCVILRLWGPDILRWLSEDAPREMHPDDSAVLHGYAPRSVAKAARRAAVVDIRSRRAAR